MKRRKKSKKLLSEILLGALIISLLSTEIVRAGYAQVEIETDEEQIIYEEIFISSAEELIALAQNCYVDAWSAGKIVTLTQDIDLTGIDFITIPIFGGIFNGDGHTISGFHYQENGYVAGFFRYLDTKAVVNNLTVKGSVQGSEDQETVGGLCGVNQGTIRNCTFHGSVSGKHETGGIAAINTATGLIQRCSTKGVISGYYETGGISGKNYGTIDNCKNYANINHSKEWVAQDDEMGGGIWTDISDNTWEVELQSGIDTGGIAGFSAGSILRSSNHGIIGYERTGYNIGGIVGRQSGLVSSCTNHGTVYGRKDIGGIVGQLEPYIEVNEAESLRKEMTVLHDLIDKALNDMQSSKNATKEDMERLQNYADGVLNSSDVLTDQMTYFVNANMEEINAVTDRIDKVLEMLPAIMDHFDKGQSSILECNKCLEKTIEDANISGMFADERVKSATDNIEANLAVLSEQMQEIDELRERIEAYMTDESGNQKSWDELKDNQDFLDNLSRLAELLTEVTNIAVEVMSDLGSVLGVYQEYGSDATKVIEEGFNECMEKMQTTMDNLQAGTDGIRGIVDYLNAQRDIEFTVLGEVYQENLAICKQQLRGMADCVESMSNTASNYMDVINQDFKAINKQIEVVGNLFMDKIDAVTNQDTTILYEDVSEEEINAATTGRVDYCTNKGSIKGDINVGGIAGSMSIDEEDPEDNAAGTAQNSLGAKYLTKCIIRNGNNEGFITAKKDGAGGIVGYMHLGIVMDSVALGSVESTGGDYAGGICGQSLAMIRNCYASCDISGTQCVGGIAGFATTVSDCYAMVRILEADSRYGAIAGQIKEVEAQDEKQVKNNYFVSDVLHGIDSISYAGIAQPITYQEMLTVEGIPSQFRHLKVIFKVDDIKLGTQEVAYGEMLAQLNFPAFPEKDGYYGVWPEMSQRVMTGNLVIQGEYKEYIKVLTSEESVPASSQEKTIQKPLALAEYTFEEGVNLHVTQLQESKPDSVKETLSYVTYEVALERAELAWQDSISLRLYSPYEEVKVWQYQEGQWISVPTMMRGSYVQVDMTDVSGIYCVVENKIELGKIIEIAIASVVVTVWIAGVIYAMHRFKNAEKLRKNGKK